MSWTVILCRKCGEWCGAPTGGQASAVWRFHFMREHTNPTIAARAAAARRR